MITKDNLYFCYSKKLSEYLTNKGIRYLFAARELNKHTIFSVYERTDELKTELENYKLNKEAAV